MPWGPKRTAYPQPPHRTTARDHLVARGMATLGIEWVPTPLATLTGSHDGRSPCMNYGYCQWGCKSRAKSSMHVSYVPKAVLAGAEIRTGARAVRLELGRHDEVSGVTYVQAGFPHLAVLGAEGECLPNPANRVELSDELGVPRPLVTFDFGANEKALREEAHRIGREILEAAGAVEILVSEGNDHTMGRCRMGDDPASSVVDGNLKAHDHPNLYVCDASVFVTPRRGAALADDHGAR